ncbi:hypothetical protein KUW00_05065 [Halomonas sp. DP5N14-9]|uniref:hypothetical protein n=1 Tax=Halomonas sp. DP5N14-9 TaxID=2859075 RepID=UPI001C996417|nr:hypothetical protein [Halomonas sp. DP5N14-9]MBY5940257.1 hypothetical protein [Halomonas sp. DP5N14-9]
MKRDIYYSFEAQGFFDSAHHKIMPGDVVKITEEEREALISAQSSGRLIVVGEDGKPKVIDPPDPEIDALKDDALRRINAGYQHALSAILNDYPDAETLSFDKQEREARTWGEWQEVGGTEPATPYLDAMLAERPIGKGELVARILAKADAFVAAHGAATGRRQRLEDDIKAAREAEDRDALEAITW